MDRGAWQGTVHGVTKSRTRLSNFTFFILEKEIATHSSTLVWRISWTEEQNRLQFMEKQRVGHDCATTFLFFISINASVSAYVCLGFPGGTVVINLPDDTRDTGDVG